MSASDNLRDLIDQMKSEEMDNAIREALESVPDEAVEEGYIEAPSAEGTREVFKQLALLKLQAAAIEKAIKQLTSAANVMIGEHKGITAGGEKLAKVSRTTVHRVNADLFKETFPFAKYPQFYNVTEESRLLLDVEFKKTVLAESAIEAPATTPKGIQ